jgi:nucleoside-diphosphate-sugar epimerase
MQKAVIRARPTVVFHLASLFLSEHESKDVDSLIQSNILFGTQLVEAMVRQNVRWLVNTGTSWQHFINQEYSPVNLYAATKQAFEAILQFYVEANGFETITLKLCDTYGPEDPRPKLINLIKRVAMENQPLEMSPGEQRIDLVNVEDVIQAYILAAERLMTGEVLGHERYIVSSGQKIQLREVVRQVERILGRELPIVWGGRPYRNREVMLPWSDALLPGWESQVTLEQGLLLVFKDLVKK